ncbi:cytochrome b5 [Russula earlei]|uniref:Cytochrome b5 n=1 Tax=Russula earlei TaxID=71964 RepID=A0ACC0UET6_9AGAM|nr:cytochrome b5 [Russula earlei]
MASYLRSWLPILSVQQNDPESAEEDESPSTPTTPSLSVQGPDDDSPPAFPAVESAQRLSSAASPSPSQKSKTSSSALMPPPPAPTSRLTRPLAPSSASSLMPPPTTTKPPTPLSKSKKREKVALAPGHSPLDWANLKGSGADLRVCSSASSRQSGVVDQVDPLQGGTTSLARIPPSVLRTHHKRDDAWAAFNGKVYNITPYLSFHPGGEKELMRVAGRDGTKLFSLTHAWVNVDLMLDACLVGFLVPEPSS